MSQVEKVLKIQPDRFVIFYRIVILWNSSEQSADMKMPRSKTLLVGLLISRSGFTYTLVLFEFGDNYRTYNVTFVN